MFQSHSILYSHVLKPLVDHWGPQLCQLCWSEASSKEPRFPIFQLSFPSGTVPERSFVTWVADIIPKTLSEEISPILKFYVIHNLLTLLALKYRSKLLFTSRIDRIGHLKEYHGNQLWIYKS